ncbi:hypothetical protein OG874_16490 [Nocardia sp. NBC_00565]|uniref:hypothetical protein n=1 Tax=Nocardia sp. NBC_00565 TaxID=2975993 RepID=UPI002E80F0E2|nr:hypothetical protein [Nocardia sp. NBC_00565]WUC06617.1 hypothetical protein OG874_16490 [Nocardia sp. NBC_00565]
MRIGVATSPSGALMLVVEDLHALQTPVLDVGDLSTLLDRPVWPERPRTDNDAPMHSKLRRSKAAI